VKISWGEQAKMRAVSRDQKKRGEARSALCEITCQGQKTEEQKDQKKRRESALSGRSVTLHEKFFNIRADKTRIV